MKTIKSMLKKIVLSSCFCLSFFASVIYAQTYVIPANTPEHIREAVANSQRSMEDSQRDAIRKPAEILTLADLNVGDHIVELSALGQYYTTMLAQAVGPSGRIDMYDLPPWQRFGADQNGMSFAEDHANVSYTMEYYDQTSYARNVDAVYNILSYHDLPSTGVDTEQMNVRIYAALRPQGKYVIVDHKARNGAGWSDAESLHRVDPQTIYDEVTAAGFVLLSESDLLANPNDDKSMSVFSAGGNTDRVVYIFQKP